MQRSRLALAIAAAFGTSAFADGGVAGGPYDAFSVLPAISFPKQHGPGRKTLHTYWKNVGASKYSPHTGAKERAKARAKQLNKLLEG